VLVGINLLREGLDIPECGLVAILDADKEGFLRSKPPDPDHRPRRAQRRRPGDPLCRPHHRLDGTRHGRNQPPPRKAAGLQRSSTASRPKASSLYGARRAPPPELLRQIDTVLIDLQDIGLRCFTYAATMSDVMRAAAKQGVRVMVLDRPNPLGGLKIDGPLMDPALASPVGALPTPFRHGLTLGELAGLIQANERLELDLSVLPMRGWTPAMGSTVFGKGQLPFTPPSPNLRSPGAVLAYAASVLLEGCNVSEGRGTARPFETLGAPWCDGPALARALSALRLPGVRFSPLRFTPTSSKHAGQTCSGIRFVVLDETRYDPLLTGLSIVAALRRLHPQDFTFLLGERPFFDLLIGQSWVREALLLAEPAKAIVQRWQGDADRFRRLVPRFRIYS
jgi:uncharacterized protein YbbC (DUF1343 family)